VSKKQSGRLQPFIDFIEHNAAIPGKRVGMYGFSGTAWVALSVDDDGVLDVAFPGTITIEQPVDVTPDSPVANDYLPVRMTDGTSFIGDVGNPVRIDPTGTTTQPVSFSGGVDISASLSVVDANNSSTTPLGIGGVFTGTGTEVLDYSFITVHVFADENSATDGVTFQFSTDNTNWDDVYSFNLDAATSDTRRFQFPVTARYFRVVYTNGSTGQGAFRLQTLLHPNSSITSIHRVDGLVTDDRSCELIKGINVAKKPNGDYINIEATAGGNLKVAVEEFDTELPAGDNNIGNVDVVTLPTLPAGDNNIGNVDVVTLPSIPAGSNLIGSVDVTPTSPVATDYLPVRISGGANFLGGASTPIRVDPTGTTEQPTAYVDSSATVVKTVTITTGTANQTVISAGASETLHILSMTVTSGDTVLRSMDIFEEGNGATPEVSEWVAANGGGFHATFGDGWELTEGDDLQCTPSAAAGSNSYKICVTYKVVTS
jgi:hypothetical protein